MDQSLEEKFGISSNEYNKICENLRTKFPRLRIIPQMESKMDARYLFITPSGHLWTVRNRKYEPCGNINSGITLDNRGWQRLCERINEKYEYSKKRKTDAKIYRKEIEEVSEQGMSTGRFVSRRELVQNGIWHKSICLILIRFWLWAFGICHIKIVVEGLLSLLNDILAVVISYHYVDDDIAF